MKEKERNKYLYNACDINIIIFFLFRMEWTVPFKKQHSFSKLYFFSDFSPLGFTTIPIELLCILDLLFCQITTSIKVCVAFFLISDPLIDRF